MQERGEGGEADAKPVCDYADRLAALSDRRPKLQVFVATDDLSTVDELAACETTRSLQWGLWHFDGQPGRGTSEAITYRLWAEVTMLRDATWAVGTFTSNVGRLVQVLRTQPEETFASVDAAWYPGS